MRAVGPFPQADSTEREITTAPTRVETDSLGQRELPAEALYGVNTLRAVENFPLSGRTIGSLPGFVAAIALVKAAAARANADVGALPADRAQAIRAACEEVRTGSRDAHFPVDVLEGSGGTSSNMNANEVIANLAALLSGQPIGEYGFVHPNDHVNLGQSTNDVIPTAMKLAISPRWWPPR